MLTMQLPKNSPVAVTCYASLSVKVMCRTPVSVSGHTIEFYIVFCLYKACRVLLIACEGISVHNDVKRYRNATFLHVPRDS